jgi:acetyl coenzyme A synthetase (ADP forming)-like protein
MASRDLENLFNPCSVAIFGASERGGSIGFNLVQNLKASGYEGRIFPINPKYEKVLGEICYPDVSVLPESPALTIMAIPAAVVSQEIERACERGARTFIVIASGFKEVGRHDLEAELVSVIRKHGARVLGPNVFGVYSARAKMNATFGPSDVRPGNVALISQSGALGVALMGRSTSENIGLSAVVSIGNEADITEREALAYLGEDEATKVIFLYMEGCRDGREFMEVASRVSLEKPIIAVKAGSSSKGALAAASHTGALAGSDMVFSAALKQTGVIRSDSLDDTFNWIRVLANSSMPERGGAVILTNGGGVGVMATDAAEKYGVQLIDDQEMLERVFRPSMPEFGSTRNPVDITGQGRNEEYGLALKAALEEPSIPSVVGLYCTPATMDVRGFAKTAVETTKQWRRRKPMTFAIIGGGAVPECIRALNDNGLPCYATPDEAMSSMGVVQKRWRWLNRERTKPEDYDMDLDVIKDIIARARSQGLSQLLESDCAQVLRLAGLQLPETRTAANVDEALAMAEEIGYPVVLKVLSPEIVHKTEYGCVKLDLEDGHELRVAYESIMAEARRHVPRARIHGVTVTEMVSDAIETILGFSVDQSFGPVLMFGMGGIYVEVLKDVAFRVAPISRTEAMKMVKEIASYPILAGARGKEIRDIGNIVDSISRISYLATHTDDILELDINPLMVLGQGKGCRVVDSRMTIRRKVTR